MTLLRGLAIALVVIVLLAGAGLAYYLFGPNSVSSAKLVPGDTILFASIPNAASIAGGYETSQLKKLVDAPQTQPLFDEIQHVIGDKNLALLKVLLPDLSGQSFVALTHFDPNHPLETGFVAAMKPKPGTDNFDTFVTQVNAAYPELARETKTGQDKLLGVDYQWIEGAHSPGRICVAHYHGWIVTAWGEASLQDWIERMQGKSATPSLADNAGYKKSLDRIGAGSQAVLYLDYHAVMQLLIDHLNQQTPGFGAQMQKQLAGIGAAVIGTSFDHGEIVDRFSILEPKDVQTPSFTSPQIWTGIKYGRTSRRRFPRNRPSSTCSSIHSVPGRRGKTSTYRRTSSTRSGLNIPCRWNGRPTSRIPTSASSSRSTSPTPSSPS
jgi:hypothetical protein